MFSCCSLTLLLELLEGITKQTIEKGIDYKLRDDEDVVRATSEKGY
jgi:hypothetical protein